MKAERGQALVLVSLMLVVIIGFVGLAVDGGRIYTLRREMQNAADATALAGARELGDIIIKCGSGSVDNDNIVAIAVVEFARQNGVDHFDPDATVTAWYVDADENRLGNVGFGLGIPNGATGVEVSMMLTKTTTFMKVVGHEDFSVPATAMAMVGRISNINGGGMLPIAVPKTAIQGLKVGENFVVFEKGVFCRESDPSYCFIGAGDDPDDPGPNSQHGWLNMSHIYNVDQNGGPLDRAFVKNLSTADCKYDSITGGVDAAATGLKGWASGQCPYPYTIFAGDPGALNGDFVHGLSGMNTSAMGSIQANYSTGDLAILPVFDYIYSPNTMDTVFQGQEPAVGWATGGGGNTSAYYYHIIGFVTVELSKIVKTPKPEIHGRLVSQVIGDGQVVPGGGIGTCNKALLLGVTLWK